MHTKGALIVFCILYGFFSGSFVSLPPMTVVSLSPSLGIVGTRMGMVFACAGLGLLIGSPVAGAILGDGSSFVGLQVFCASTVVASGVVAFAARFAKVGTKVSIKA